MKFVKLVVAILVMQMAGVIGAVFTVPAIPGWYEMLNKPALNPPAWLFGPAWVTLYLLIGIAAWLVWSFDGAREIKRRALTIFGIQWLLNASWSVVFFGLQSPSWALVNIVALWAVIIWMMVAFARVSKWAMYLLIPYILWVSFAMYLNYAIWVLN